MSDSITQGLAANVLRLGNEVRDLAISNAVLRDDNAKLKAEVEALLKAGDAMAADLPPFGSVKAWNAAKEGKPSV